MYHIKTTEQDVAPYVVLPGDPKRVPLVAALWDESKLIADNREHVTYTGIYKGMPISCTSTGMGCPSTAIAVEELARCGAKTFLRMGTCAAIQDNITKGDIVIFDSACRFEGTSHQYVPPEYPAVQTAQKLNLNYHVGTARTSDALFANRPEDDASFGGYHRHDWGFFLSDLKQMKVLAGDMESSIVMILSRLFGLRGGALCVCVTNLLKQYEKGGRFDYEKDIAYSADNVERLNKIACETMYQIYLNDQNK
jgi:uridine phosphorylase